MSNLPKISVVTPSYNQGKYLESTIRSVLNQSYPALEYIIIDGKSQDKSIEIIKKYEPYLYYWESTADNGQSHAINKGFAKSTGDILCWINSDDELEPGALHIIAEMFSGVSKPQWLIGAAIIINKRGKKLRIRAPGDIAHTTFMHWGIDWFPQQSTAWTRAMWTLAGPLDEDLHYAMDLALWERMYRISPPLITAKILASYRVHDDAKCLAHARDAIAERAKCIKGIVQRKWSDKLHDTNIGALEELAEDYAEIQELLACSHAYLRRLQKHPIIGCIMKWWKINIDDNTKS